jgi:hypothetical protein
VYAKNLRAFLSSSVSFRALHRFSSTPLQARQRRLLNIILVLLLLTPNFSQLMSLKNSPYKNVFLPLYSPQIELLIFYISSPFQVWTKQGSPYRAPLPRQKVVVKI